MWLLLRVQNLLGRVFMRYRLNVGGVDWGEYKPDLVANTDFRKFDGVLRLGRSDPPPGRTMANLIARDEEVYIPADMADEFSLGILPRLEQTRGFCSASLLVNRSSGLGCVTTGWKTRAEMQAAGPATDEMSSRAMAEAGCEVLEVHAFDLVYAHLHVPHMA